jgi:thymidylate kinase/thymidylate synthase ThyX
MSNQQSSNRGIFITIEGSDGAGKGTQAKLLVERLVNEGYDVAQFDFPQYEQESSYFVREYLNGKFGTGAEVGPYTASLFFALDRYEASFKIREALDAGKVVITNRFTGSNMAHQGTKFTSVEERRGYFIWLDNLEFQMLKIPRPDFNFVLSVPAEIAQELVDQKGERNYTKLKRDIHEADLNHLKKSVEIYDDMTSLFPKDFTRVDCVRSGKLLSVDTIHNLLWDKVKAQLPAPQDSNAQVEVTKVTSTLEQNPYVTKTDAGYEITEQGKDFLNKSVTSNTDNVYVFNETLSPTTVAAAMARLSRRSDDMRITILDEFAHAMGKDQKLLQRVITAYGDDSVQQLVGIQFVVENASNLLTKKLEWGRLAAYLEQSTRYIYFDQKDQDGNYKYYVPEHFDADTKELYVRAMDAIFDSYSDMVHRLSEYVAHNSDTPESERDGAWKGAVRAQACDAVRAVLPVATKSTVGIYASGQATENLIMNLLADELPEARATGQKILEHARTIIPTFLERADKPERGGATVAYRANTKRAVSELAKELLSNNHATNNQAVTLTNYWPRNELDLVPDILYEHSSLPLSDIQKEVDGLSYDQKHTVFAAFIGERLNRRHKPGRALEKAHYSWDLVCDYGIFRDLQRHRMVDDLNWQQLTPRYGYDIPPLVEEAGLTDQFEECFDLSLKLHSLLQEKGYGLEAQYATLLGHKMRWKITYNAREAFHFHELRTSPQGHPGYRKLVLEMHEKLASVHPMLAEAMQFVNKGEDDKLTRLAAERYTQYKLENLQ